MIDKKLLEKYESIEEIDNFFNYINYNFGEGEILPEKHIENIFKKKITHPTLAEYYIDTYRTLEMMSKDTNVLFEINKEDLLGFHHQIIKEFKIDSDSHLEKKYKEQVSLFEHYYCDEKKYKIEIIRNIKELDWEGKYMNHCIATYRYIVSKGEYIGFKFFNKNSWERLTLGCRNIEGDLVFDQLKAHSNYPASQESRKFVIDYCNKMKIKYNLDFNYDLM